ncbi:MAG: hypothetical protein QOJ91_448 [Sphingomonadales bacterium]|jgi:hypothetical protein|nr:hypothetical protein [Sphingomonadales bacterium]
MDEKTEALIGPEPILDPAEAEALRRRVAAEDTELRIRIAGPALYAIAAFVAASLFLFAPLLERIGRSGQLLFWIGVNLPLIPFLLRARRQSRLPLGMGHALEGDRARKVATGILLLSLLVFFWAGLAGAAWEWMMGGGAG